VSHNATAVLLNFGDEANRRTAGTKGSRRSDVFEAAAEWGNAQGRSFAGPGRACLKYSLAYVNTAICGADNGRVLGYDNSDHHHRHFMGKQEPFEFFGYEALATLFYDEVRELWRKEDEERGKRH
jgi:hypothetical protein